MDAVKFFRGYGRVSEIVDTRLRSATRRRLILIAASTAAILLVFVAVTIAVSKRGRSPSPESVADSIRAMCNVTRYPASCFSSVSAANGANLTNDPEELFGVSLAVAMDALQAASAAAAEFAPPSKDRRLAAALRDCRELLGSATDRLNNSIALMRLAAGEATLNASEIEDLRTWLSAALTDQDTCLEGFEGTTGGFLGKMEAATANATQYTSNSLAIATGILGVMEKSRFPLHRRRLLSAGGGRGWMRRALQAERKRKPNVTVAADGSGQVRSIKAAVDLAPRRSEEAFVIYVKGGVYEEQVVVGKDQWNVVMIGDGMDKTVVEGNLNFVGGTPTFSTATFIAEGKGFVAMDMGFKNSAGPEKHQAVALRSSSDRSVFFRCAIDSFQGSLYAHSLRQFYRECHIAGTVDFIFGNAAATFQACQIRPKQALLHQQNTVTAQGKFDPNQNTGFALQACSIQRFDADVTVPSYLGRPWKDYSTTVVLQSEIGSVIDPAGWLPWVVGEEPPNTIRYGEYQNSGAGSSVAGRIHWAGYSPAMSEAEAKQYTVEALISGGDWIPATGVQFQSNLG
ncbi:pectinesterase 3 [Curcuma longa]|uniref:pectinesterase 3 n=1 Tax=Curcuma longa TaxID=136217 RepID=UPI003D9EAC52